MKVSPAAKKALLIGSMCSLSYLAVYVAKNILSAASPQMIEGGQFTTENIGTLSSVYFIAYAIGQLINGKLGDVIKGKYMISIGLLLAGICHMLFLAMADRPMVLYVIYGAMGFSLSMIYGPMTRIVAENTQMPYTTRCSLGYTFASFVGSPLAGVLAALFIWRTVFSTTGVLLILMGCVCFVVFTLFERAGLVEYNKYRKPKETGGIAVLIKHQIIKFTLIAAITGVVRTSVVFWLPTYLTQHLGFSPERSAMLFTIATCVISLTAFVAIFIYERLGQNMDLTILLAFCSAAICFMGVFVVRNSAINIVLMILAIFSSNCASSMLWSRYCPGLRDTGMVSSATGFLDFVSYMAASAATKVMASMAGNTGWSTLILSWFSLMVIGVIIALPYKKLSKKGKNAVAAD